MAIDSDALDSPASLDTNQRPKRRKIETEKVRESRETTELEAAAAKARASRAAAAAVDVGATGMGVEAVGADALAMMHAGLYVPAADTQAAPSQDEEQERRARAHDVDDALYQPPAADAGDDEENENGDVYDHYQSDKPPRHALQGTFLKDLVPMMIGFGDDESPSLETVEFVEEALVSYSIEVLKSALDLSKQRGRMRSTGKPSGPPTAEDVVTVVRKDARKVKRIEELLIMQQEIKVAQDSIEKQEDLETLAQEHDEK